LQTILPSGLQDTEPYLTLRPKLILDASVKYFVGN